VDKAKSKETLPSNPDVTAEEISDQLCLKQAIGFGGGSLCDDTDAMAAAQPC
jgi:hypothetical protein